MNTYLDANQFQVSTLVTELIDIAVERRVMQVIEMIKPSLSKDGDQFCYLLGENLQDGIAGFGDTVGQAMQNFVTAFWTTKA